MSRKFNSDDRISFVAGNPKKPGSDAFERYAKYSSARSVQEAVHLGAWKGDLKYDESKGYLKRGRPRRALAKVGKGKAQAKVKNLKVKVQKNSRQPANTSTTSGLAMSYVKDVPLSLLEGEEGLKLWQEMQEAGWRRCEFRFLAGARKGFLYKRFVQPPAKKESSKMSAPLGKSINGGFPTAIKLYAKSNPEAKDVVQKLLDEKAEISKSREKPTPVMHRDERGKCIQAYRKQYGCLGSTALLLKRHPEWQEEAEAFVSPDGEQFVKSKSANNLLHLLGDMEAHIGKQLLLKDSGPREQKIQVAQGRRSRECKKAAMAKSKVTITVVEKRKTKVETKRR
jgi:hypothetical protein